MGELRRHAETALDVGSFAALMLPAVAIGITLAVASQGLRVGLALMGAVAIPSR